jgi:hypothetical protein
VRDTSRVLLALEDKAAITHSNELIFVVSNSSVTVQSFNVTRSSKVRLNEELFNRRIKACDVCKVSGSE